MTFTGHFPGLFVDYDIFKSKGILLFFSFGAAQQAPGGILPGTDPINTTDFRTDVRLPAATTQLLKI